MQDNQPPAANPWNALVDVFGQPWDSDSVPEYAADNIVIAWPSLRAAMTRLLPAGQALNVLDFGCGGGLWCRQLHALGHRVTGYEPAQDLVESARRNAPPPVRITDAPAAMQAGAPYDLITAVMVFPFIADLEAQLRQLAGLLRPQGCLLFAAFNPPFVRDNAGDDQPFQLAPGADHGRMALRPEVSIPCYLRSAEQHRALCAPLGLREVYHDTPPFTREFLERYAFPLRTRHGEYLIQGFGFDAQV